MEEPHKVRYVVPTTDALAALLRRVGVEANQLAAALPEDMDEAQRTTLHRMVMDLREQLVRCELSAGLARANRPGIFRCGDRV